MEHGKPQPATEYVSGNDKLTEPALIANLLRRMHEDHALLTITLPGSDSQYKSVVLEVNLARGFILLDELHPPEGHTLFLGTKKLQVLTRLKGVDISFSALLQQATRENGMALYQVGLPSLIHYRQRRASYRVRVGAGLVVPVSLENGDLPHLQGSLCDISAGGIGLRLKLDPSMEVHNGTIFPDCEIHLPDDTRVRSSLELRFVSPADQRSIVRFGGRFLKLESGEQKLIEQFVVSLEREMLKKRTKE